MSRHVGHQLSLSASRVHPRILPASHQYQYQHQHEPHRFASICLSAPGQRRHFGISDAAGGLLQGSQFLITNIHEVTGAPWFISLPLVALLVSATIRTPLAIYTHMNQRKRAKLTPLIQAQSVLAAIGLRRKAVPNLRKRVAGIVRKKSKELFETFAVTEYRSILGGLAGLPIFLSNLEVIRRMCGGPRGLLGGFMFGFGGDGSKDATVATRTETAETAEVVTASSASTPAAGDTVSVADIPSPADLGEFAMPPGQDVLSIITLEPTFATGGCLWFPNLLVADPYHVLPFAVSALLLMHIMPEGTAAKRALFGLKPAAGDNTTMVGQTKSMRGLQRGMLIAALAVGPVTMDLPAALHLYWMSSVGFSLVVTKGIDMLMPITKSTLKPCRGVEMPLLRPRPS